MVLRAYGFAVRFSGRAVFFPDEEVCLKEVGGLLRAIQEHYGKRLEVSVIDPRNITALWDAIRYRIKLGTPAWVLGRRKIFQGVPEFEKLKEAIDAVL
ncbi:MAG: hypothetical protein LBQ57_08420 [Spirochaetales bacterium]|jgi:hypothetical protein|nr:hypothetical protein [Spirochaetales bacterium]